MYGNATRGVNGVAIAADLSSPRYRRRHIFQRIHGTLDGVPSRTPGLSPALLTLGCPGERFEKSPRGKSNGQDDEDVDTSDLVESDPARMPRPRIEADDEQPPRQRQPPIEELHDEMTATDIAHSLEYLTFIDGFGLIKVDHGVRDFLLRAVRIDLGRLAGWSFLFFISFVGGGLGGHDFQSR